MVGLLRYCDLRLQFDERARILLLMLLLIGI
jgi:hypothetical protein